MIALWHTWLTCTSHDNLESIQTPRQWRCGSQVRGTPDKESTGVATVVFETTNSLHLDGLKICCHSFPHVSTTDETSMLVASAGWRREMCHQTLRSSAKPAVVVPSTYCRRLKRSPTKTRKRIGESGEPWGTPKVSDRVHTAPFTLT